MAIVCQESGRACHLHDHALGRRWRFLDPSGFERMHQARVSRIIYPKSGAKSEAIRWAPPQGWSTFAFEAMVIKVVKACASAQVSCELLKLEWSAVGLMGGKPSMLGR